MIKFIPNKMKLKKENKSINKNKLILKRWAQRMSPNELRGGARDKGRRWVSFKQVWHNWTKPTNH